MRTAPQLPVPGPLPPPPPPPPPGPTPPPEAVARFIGEPDENPWIVSIDRRRLTAAETALVIERLISKTSYLDGAVGCYTNDPTHITLQRGKRRLALETSCTNVLLAGEHIGTFDPETATYLESLRSARAARVR